jgi:hypothetical protein
MRTDVAIMMSNESLIFPFVSATVLLQYDKFSKTVGDAAIQQQRLMQDSLKALSDTISDFAIATNATWPMVQLPRFAQYAQNARKTSGSIETFIFGQIVKPEDELMYQIWGRQHYEKEHYEAHMLEFGNTDLIDFNTTKFGVGFEAPSYGDNETYRADKVCSWQFAPPYPAYGTYKVPLDFPYVFRLLYPW